MHRSGGKPRTKREVIIKEWKRLGGASIGHRELDQIQQAIADRFGKAAVDSPAAIARSLADQGAELRHPEVIEFDARWRESRIEKNSGQFKGLDELLTGRPLRFKNAEALIKKLEKLRKRAENSGAQMVSNQARNMAVTNRKIAESFAKDRKLNQHERAEQAEIAEWFKVWLQTPGLFSDWLDLRRRSREFQDKFSAKEVAP